MNRAANLLQAEHEIIINAVGLISEAGVFIGKDCSRYEKTVKELIYFYRNYADKYHHYKEEIVLFPEMGRKNELLDNGVIKEMFEHHEDFRNMLSVAEQLLEKSDYEGCGKQLRMYAEAILDHIAVENDELFQMLETVFDNEEINRIYFRFEDIDRDLGVDEKHRMEENINRLILETTSIRQ